MNLPPNTSPVCADAEFETYPKQHTQATAETRHFLIFIILHLQKLFFEPIFIIGKKYELSIPFHNLCEI